MRAITMANMGKEPPVSYEAKKKPWKMSDREIYNSLCEIAGMACEKCQLCEFGKEALKRGLIRGKKE